MKNQRPGEMLRLFALLFLLPGLAGVIFSGWVSTSYFASLPRVPVPAEMRMIPRSVNGVVVYQTQEEDRRLTILEGSSIATFFVGLGLGVVHLHRWGIVEVIMGKDVEEDLVSGKVGS